MCVTGDHNHSHIQLCLVEDVESPAAQLCLSRPRVHGLPPALATTGHNILLLSGTNSFLVYKAMEPQPIIVHE